MKRYVLSLERNMGKEGQFRVSGGSEFQSRGPMTEKALLFIYLFINQAFLSATYKMTSGQLNIVLKCSIKIKIHCRMPR